MIESAVSMSTFIIAIPSMVALLAVIGGLHESYVNEKSQSDAVTSDRHFKKSSYRNYSTKRGA